MKTYFTFFLIYLSFNIYGQDKYNYVQFNKLTEIEGTEFVIASIDNRSKIEKQESKYLLFIDTKTGDTNQIDFPGDGYIGQIEQIKIDDLGINKIIVIGKTVDLDGKKGIDWTDPQQLFVLTTHGQEKIQVTDDEYFMSTWTVNHQTGSVIITGHYDTNKNGKYDKTDKSEILIFDLKSLKLIKKI